MLKNTIASGLAKALEHMKEAGVSSPTRSGYVVESIEKVPHFYGCAVGIARARKEIRRLGPAKAAEMEHLKGVRVEMVEVKRLRYVDRSKYTGAKLREIRRRKGVGRPPKGSKADSVFDLGIPGGKVFLNPKQKEA